MKRFFTMHMKDGDKDEGNSPKLFSVYLIGNMCVPGTANEEIKDC